MWKGYGSCFVKISKTRKYGKINRELMCSGFNVNNEIRDDKAKAFRSSFAQVKTIRNCYNEKL